MRDNGEIVSIRSYPSPNRNIRLDEITYWSCGNRVKGLLARPQHIENPQALLYLRGGLQSIGMVRAARIAQFAAQGFVVFAPYYRGNRGGEGKDEFAGEDRYDAVFAVDVLKQFTQEKSIHIYGFSRGGLMAMWVAILRGDIASTVIWAGTSDVAQTYWDRVDMRRGLRRIIGGTPNKVLERYNDRTPLFAVEEIEAPVLLVHGTADQHVYIEHAYRLEGVLQEKGKQVEVWYAADIPHHYPPQLNRETVKKIGQWMKGKRDSRI